ncbi:stage V sporulation protein AC [Candidatus Arthromitus sp. SFB-rat-Yit]|uniref:stage V sporulation protein AC n=1 Tax=Candidatus Arthromitus sp. SFB-rat-Yit TaxID=1041504 RepID=UPI00030CE8FA|nr:stage V sporulation protein AC [Candidatus Arthromitus sp. SFB-rat-Yit]
MSFDEKRLRKTFEDYSKNYEPKPNYIKRFVMSFIIGGIFCVIGELLFKFYANYIFDELQVRALGSITMIFIGSFLTGIGIYDKIANIAGAGSIVPITGFANAVTSPAIEFKKEGVVFGTCVKMFTIAGSVIAFGVTSSVLVGIGYFIFSKFVG